MQPNINEFTTMYKITEVLNHIKENILPEIQKSAKEVKPGLELLGKQIREIEMTMQALLNIEKNNQQTDFDIIEKKSGGILLSNRFIKQKPNFKEIEKEGGETVISKSNPLQFSYSVFPNNSKKNANRND